MFCYDVNMTTQKLKQCNGYCASCSKKMQSSLKLVPCLNFYAIQQRAASFFTPCFVESASKQTACMLAFDVMRIKWFASGCN